MYHSLYGYPFFNPYFGYRLGGYGVGINTAINSIGSQFNNQSLVNTGIYTGSNQIQSPVNIW